MTNVYRILEIGASARQKPSFARGGFSISKRKALTRQ
jgi:hypothetical protein